MGRFAGAAVILAKRALIDIWTVLIATCMLVALLSLKKVPEPVLISAQVFLVCWCSITGVDDLRRTAGALREIKEVPV